MKPEKMKKLQSITLESIQGKKMKEIKQTVGEAFLLLKLDIKIDFEECMKEAKAKGITDLKSSKLLENEQFKSAAQALKYVDMLKNVDDTSEETILTDLEKLLSVNVEDIEVTEEIYNDDFTIKYWNAAK
ncbi:hypothetical protein [Anaerorhabdus sp.]|uniref:hypothetical protein n=1 Tax=Anaerorhabdus sp. TaxID=1872524 RepID=UPI002FC98CAC